MCIKHGVVRRALWSKLIAKCLCERLLIFKCKLFSVSRVWLVHKHPSHLGMQFKTTGLHKFSIPSTAAVLAVSLLSTSNQNGRQKEKRNLHITHSTAVLLVISLFHRQAVLERQAKGIALQDQESEGRELDRVRAES